MKIEGEKLNGIKIPISKKRLLFWSYSKTSHAISKKILIISFLFMGCNPENKKGESDSKLLAKVDSLLNENRKLNEQLSKASLQGIENSNDSQADKDNKNIATNNKSKYAFVVLRAKITSRGFIHEVGGEGTVIRRPYICSDIKIFDSFNEDKKYHFLDEIQINYIKDKIQKAESTTEITYRECFVFNSYEEASKEREKYLISEQ